MTLEQAKKNLKERQDELELRFIEDFRQIVKILKPEAKQFSFDGNSESDDEGGSYMSFSSFYIDDQELEDIVAENPTLAAKVFDCEIDESSDVDEVYDFVRDNFYGLPDFVYDNTWGM